MDLSLKIQEILKKNIGEADQLTRDQIVEELHIYHEELFFQNEELKRLNERLNELHLQFKMLFQEAPIAYLYIDSKGVIIDSNQYFENTFGKRDSGDKIYKWIYEADQDLFYQYFRLVKKSGNNFSTSLRFKKDNNVYHMKLGTKKIFLQEKDVYLISLDDVTTENRYLVDIEELTFRDPLTGLYNRRFFLEELKRIDRKRNLPIGIISLDINGLKLINDTFGHEYGDLLLKKAADALKQLCRDDEIIARLGGDEFIILLYNITLEELERLYIRIQKGTKSVEINDVSLSIAAGYGIKLSENVHIRDTIADAEKMMYRNKLFMNSTQYKRIIDGILATLHEKHPNEELHSNRVSILMEKFAVQMGLDENERIRYRAMGLLHDIGKIAIDYSILDKHTVLTAAEYDEVKRHSEIGYRILKSAGIFQDIIEPILTHHERIDGLGYPRQLKATEISLEARALMICDAYDAITSNRPYRAARSSKEAIEEMERYTGTQFDSVLLSIFSQMINNSHLESSNSMDH